MAALVERKAGLDAMRRDGVSQRHGIDLGLARYQRLQGAFGSGIVQQGRRDGAYLSDQLKPREQRRNKALTWSVEDLIWDHNGRTAAVRRIFEASRTNSSP